MHRICAHFNVSVHYEAHVKSMIHRFTTWQLSTRNHENCPLGLIQNVFVFQRLSRKWLSWWRFYICSSIPAPDRNCLGNTLCTFIPLFRIAIYLNDKVKLTNNSRFYNHLYLYYIIWHTANVEIKCYCICRHQILDKILNSSTYDPMISPNYEDGKTIIFFFTFMFHKINWMIMQKLTS